PAAKPQAPRPDRPDRPRDTAERPDRPRDTARPDKPKDRAPDGDPKRRDDKSPDRPTPTRDDRRRPRPEDDKGKDKNRDRDRDRRPKDKDPAEAKQQKRDERRKKEDSKESKDERLEKIVARIRPQIARMLDKGVRDVMLRGVLRGMRGWHRLTDLYLSGSDAFSVTAELNPSRSAGSGIKLRPTHLQRVLDKDLMTRLKAEMGDDWVIIENALRGNIRTPDQEDSRKRIKTALDNLMTEARGRITDATKQLVFDDQESMDIFIDKLWNNLSMWRLAADNLEAQIKIEKGKREDRTAPEEGSLNVLTDDHREIISVADHEKELSYKEYLPLKNGRAQGIRARLRPGGLGGGSHAESSITPSGWNGNPDEEFARGHLLANQLGGSGKREENLVTLIHNPVNTPKMKRFETLVFKAVQGGKTVDYEVTPIYTRPGKPTKVRLTAKEVPGGAIVVSEVLENKKPTR
ncbi:DNA/RNA non-specific endonuclease, partial [Streptomyces zhihengii]